MNKLTIELVPSTSWGNNVRSIVTKAQWDVIRKESYKKADHKCEICGGKGKRHAVECHEIWDYNEDTNTQTLKGLISLCPACHMVKHAGRSFAIGKPYVVINQLKKVNECTEAQAYRDIAEAFTLHEERSKKTWTVDISYLNKYK
jgi:5-methylcytosine-specific restriction endonuclease McrA